MQEERIVKKPATFLLTCPNRLASELLLYEVIMSRMYLMVLKPFTTIASLFSGEWP